MALPTPQLLQSALHIARQAGDHLSDFYQRNLTVHTKTDNTPVTAADLFVSRFLIEKLTALTPAIPVLSEESAHISLAQRKDWQRYWLIDPLDGTQHFINRSGQFCLLIALIEHNRPIMGIIHVPLSAHTYYAMRNVGAYKQTPDGLTRLAPRALNPAKPLKIAVGSRDAQEKVRSILTPNYQYEFLIHGSCGLKGALVAEGCADCYVRLGQTGEWDTAAAEVLLNETGGFIVDTRFQPLTYNQRETLVNPDFVMGADSGLDWRAIFQFD
ncbi:3'(2'),5'-bisphosphate nucleotidase CysQ [Necropsobacter massiliensis]|uniref:3'(2'),5'-bisphosphate nucleotidase CysQ n=1 Tax=Necropsobacter massiliensis TaxID=1400001 RepID=UPI000595A32E|nr:3'(2'),5'-bisphosphate nucleotidase CysQ [Necropsobacter massiliensis]